MLFKFWSVLLGIYTGVQCLNSSSPPLTKFEWLAKKSQCIISLNLVKKTVARNRSRKKEKLPLSGSSNRGNIPKERSLTDMLGGPIK